MSYWVRFLCFLSVETGPLSMLCSSKSEPIIFFAYRDLLASDVVIRDLSKLKVMSHMVSKLALLATLRQWLGPDQNPFILPKKSSIPFAIILITHLPCPKRDWNTKSKPIYQICLKINPFRNHLTWFLLHLFSRHVFKVNSFDHWYELWNSSKHDKMKPSSLFIVPETNQVLILFVKF